MLGLATLRLKKLMALVPTTDELLDDANALTSYLPEKVALSIRWKANESILFGAGNGIPVGCMNSVAIVTVAIRPQDEGDLFGFAGLAERWLSPVGEEVHTCCIITTDANPVMMPIHDRMPVILGANDYSAWLDSTNTDVGSLQALLRPAEAGNMIAYPVCRAVNSVRSDSPTFVEPS